MTVQTRTARTRKAQARTARTRKDDGADREASPAAAADDSMGRAEVSHGGGAGQDTDGAALPGGKADCVEEPQEPERVAVWFVGAGPGDPELITVKGQRLIAGADLVLYAGSLVPPAIVAQARADAVVVDSAPMNLQETHSLMMETVRRGGMVARVHTGDPSLYGAIREQMRLLEAEGVRCAVVPGVSAGFAAAAAAAASLTVPERSQSLIITRLEGRTPVPDTEKLRDMARHRCAMAIYLSAANAQGIADELRAGGLEEATPVIAAYRVGWPDQRIVRATLGTLCEAVRVHGLTRQTVFLVLPGEDGSERFSKLYDPEFLHGFRGDTGPDGCGTFGGMAGGTPGGKVGGGEE